MSQVPVVFLRHGGLATPTPTATDRALFCPKGDSMTNESKVSELLDHHGDHTYLATWPLSSMISLPLYFQKIFFLD